MPILERTSLNSSDKLDFVKKALACQAYGDISNLSFQHNISRNTIYKVREAGFEALATLLEQTHAHQIPVDCAQINRAIVAISCTAPNSIRAVQDLLPLIYPTVTRSFGYIQALLKEAQANAAVFNAGVDLSPIKSGAIDETFCQNEPVLAGIDLDSGFLAMLSHEMHRDGETWARVLNNAKAQGMDLLHVVKDGAPAMTCAVKEVYPDAEQRDDVFHALYITSNAVNKAEKRAYRLIDKEAAAHRALEKALKNGDEDEKEALKQKLTKAIEASDEAIAYYEFAEKGLKYLHRGFSSIHTNGFTPMALMSSDIAKTLLVLSGHYLTEACHKDCSSAARYIENRLKGLTLATTRCHEKQLTLCLNYSQDMVAQACYYYELERSLKKVSIIEGAGLEQKMDAAYLYMSTKLDESQMIEVMEKAQEMLDKRHRASSAIEGFNAILRPYMYVRKGVNQGFLELFRAWHNLRTRRCGKHKGTSAYETLTGMPVDDWLTMIGFPLSKTLH